MTTAPSTPREALELRCTTTPPCEADVEVLVVVLSLGEEVPEWLGLPRGAVAGLADGGRLTLHRTERDDFLAEVVEVVLLPSGPAAQGVPAAARGAGRAVGGAWRDRASFAVAGLLADGPCSPALAFVAGFAEGRYRFTRYRSGAPVAPATLTVVGEPISPTGLAALETAAVVEDAVAWCRDLTNTPARDLTPVTFAEEAAREAARAGATVRVHDEGWLRAEGFAGLVAVAGGSPHPPRLVEVTYRGPAAEGTPPVVLVGKGVTFDSGGLSLKRATAMMEMKSDMAGAATVLAAVCAIARIAPPGAHVVALLALAENMPGPGALRPGDILRHRNGLTTEVVNTDCEGRLVLSDTLTWATERTPAAIVDVATLTYSTIAALGPGVTSVIGNDPALVAAVLAAGEASGEPCWELPLWHPYRRLIDSPFADLRNEEHGDGAGAITAALYLHEFVGDTPWAHLDTGGTAYLDEDDEDLGAGATGTGVRSLVRWVLDRQHSTREDSS